MNESTVPGRNEVKKKQYLVLATVVATVFIVAGWAVVSSFTPKGRSASPEEKPITNSISSPAPARPQDIWIAKSEEDILRLRRNNKNLEDKFKRLQSDFATLNESTRKANEAKKVRPENGTSVSGLLPPPPLVKKNSNYSTPRLPTADVGLARSPQGLKQPGGTKTGTTNTQPAKIMEWEIPLPEAPENSSAKTVDNYLPAGSVIRIRLLAGIDAPTGGSAQTDPIPFLVKLKHDGNLPNGFTSHMKNCHVTLAGYGDISSERLYGRTEKLSCVLRNGEILEKTIDGYLSGEDGKAGMRGRLVSKQGALIARALLAGVAGGIGQGISDSYQTVTTSALGSVATVDPNKILEQGLATGVGTSLDRISKWYLQRADETYPVIEVDAARTGDIILKNGMSLDIDYGEVDSEGARRQLVTEEDRKKAATLEKNKWKK